MKKFLISLLVVAVVGGGIAWSKRADIHTGAGQVQVQQNADDSPRRGKFPGSRGPQRRWSTCG